MAARTALAMSASSRTTNTSLQSNSIVDFLSISEARADLAARTFGARQRHTMYAWVAEM